MKTTILLNLVVLLVTAASVPAATRLVPGEYATIQDAIDACVDGDVVIIASDTYTGQGNRDIDFLGKAITVRSINPNDPNIVAATIINCNGTEAEPHRGFYFHNSEGPDSVLVGLTIINGFGPDERLDINGRIYDYSVGGAIFCYQSNPTITRCKIEGNRVKLLGGGMYNYDSSLTVTNCIFSDNWAGSGGGMYNYRGNPTVTNTAFVDNGADHSAGGMYTKESNSMVTNCTFSVNSAKYGGAMYNRDDSNPIVKNCIFSNNSASRDGGGIYNYASSPTISNCTFSKNSAGEEGGGMYNCSHHNGPAIYPTVVNCTFSGNFALMDGGGIYDRLQSNTILINCILWGNSDSSGMDESAQIHKSDQGAPVVNYCCVQGWTGILGGMGNIDADPTFVYPATDNYHLLPGSPCINAGDPDYIYVPEETDIDGEPRVVDGRIDMGVDEFILTQEPIIGISPTEFEIYADVGGANPENQILTISNIGGGGTLYWMVAEDCLWLDVNPESGESTGEIDEVTLSVDISGMSSGLYICELTITADGIVNSPQTVRIILHILDNDGLLHVPSEYETIQAAIDTAVDGQAVILAPSTYSGYGNRDLDFVGKAINVRSDNPNDPVVVAATVIDCQGTEAEPHRGFRFHSGEGPDSVIAGLTITNGFGQHEHVGHTYASAGGAIFCVRSNPTITLCRIAGNHAGYMGGGIYCEESNPMIANCTFSGNWANYGGGMCNEESSPVVINCTFSGNTVPGSGGAMYNYINSNPVISNCFISGNTARIGGGLHNDSKSIPTITNCVFIGNSANYGGGVRCDYDSSPIIRNCAFVGNFAKEWGGALLNSSNSSPNISNCTFSGNYAIINGNVMANYYGGCPILYNCILWRDSTNLVSQISLREQSSVSISYCNIRDGEASIYAIEGSLYHWGEGNMDINPLLESDDYHLKPSSPCIDAGDPGFVPVPGEIDIDDEPRVMGGRVDMGADEFTSTLTPILRISPIEFQFSSYEDGPNPKAQILSIRNIGSGTLNWEIAEDCPWLEVYPPNGESTGQVNEVTLRVDISGLTPGSYNCQLTMAAEGAVNSPQVVLVTLNLGGSELYVPSEYGTIQAAIDAAIDWDTVIVADGTYTGDGNRDLDFLGKVITVRSENGPEKCIIDCNGTEDEPHRGFYFHSGEDCNSVVAGFTITNGYASRGGGIYCVSSNPTLIKCIFSGNSSRYDGGGVYNYASSPTISNCTFSKNSAKYDGGGMNNGNSSPTLNNCTFSGNFAGTGGGMSNRWGSSPTLTNCTLVGNHAENRGGGIYCENGTDPPPPLLPSAPPTPRTAPEIANGAIVGSAETDNFYDSLDGDMVITNCIIWGNEAPDGPQIYLERNSNASVSYSDVQSGWTGLGNIDVDPLFVEPGYWADANDPNVAVEPNDPNAVWVEGDYHLKSEGWRWDANRKVWTWDDVTSPCIDAGNPGCGLGDELLSVPDDPNNEWGENLRINMGAYGGTAEASMGLPGWALLADLTNDRIVDFNDLAVFVQYWLESGQCIPSDLNRNESVDFADFAFMALHWLEER